MIVFLVLLAVIAPIVIVQPLQDAVVLPKLVTTAAFTGAGLVWGGVLLAWGRWPAGRWPATIWAPVAAFVTVNVLAAALALDWRWSLLGQYPRYQGLATTLLYVLLFALTAVAVRTTRDLRWLLLGLFAGALGAAIYALIQKAGLDWVEWSGRALDRPASTVGQANAFGAYLVAVISASGFLVLSARARWQQFALGAGVLAMVFACLFTISRAAYVAAFVVLAIWSVAAVLWFAFFRLGARPHRAQLVAAGAAGAGAALLVVVLGAGVFVTLGPGQAAVGRFEDSSELQSESVGGRLTLWRLAVRMTADRPLLGSGQDAFTHRFAHYRDRPDLPGIGTANVEPESAHNFFLDLASGTGVVGLLAFLVPVGAVLWHAGRRALETDDLDVRLALIALSAGVVGYLVALFFGFSEAMTSWVLWLLLGATAGLLAQVPVRSSQNDQAARRRGLLTSGMAALALTVMGVTALGWAATLTAADLAAGQADRAGSAAATRLIGRAVTLNPLQKKYLSQKAQTYGDAADLAGDRRAALRQALDVYETLLRRFGPSAFDALGLALTRFDLAQAEGAPVEDTLDLMEQAVALDPYNFQLRSFLADFFESQGYQDRALEQRLQILSWARKD